MTHWSDKRCIACGGELPLPTWGGQPYICCSGNDCGCGGGTLPVEFCSVECWENYEPESDGEIAEREQPWMAAADRLLEKIAHVTGIEPERKALLAFMVFEKANLPLTLRDFGYAPGNYSIKCFDCGQESLFCDKRATRCETCAKQAMTENRSGLPQNAEGGVSK